MQNKIYRRSNCYYTRLYSAQRVIGSARPAVLSVILDSAMQTPLHSSLLVSISFSETACVAVEGVEKIIYLFFWLLIYSQPYLSLLEIVAGHFAAEKVDMRGPP